MSCLFCDLRETAKESMLYENEYWYALYDKFPVTKGHAICILKKHKESFFDISNEEAEALCAALKTIKEKIHAEHAPKAYNIAVNDGREAGRTIDHVHVHLIPRYGTEKGPLREVYDREENLARQGKSLESI